MIHKDSLEWILKTNVSSGETSCAMERDCNINNYNDLSPVASV